MRAKIFQIKRNNKSLTAIRANETPATVLLAYRSPLASAKADYWLEQKLLRVYTRYYLRVNWENIGLFWKGNEPIIKVQYENKEEGDF